MPANYLPTSDEYLRILPEIILILTGIIIMLIEAFRGPKDNPPFHAVTLGGIVAAFAGCFASTSGPAFHDMLAVDGFATFFRVIVLIVGALTTLMSLSYLDREKADKGEFYGLLLFSLSGQTLMCASNELIMIFIGLEISSIASYIMAGFMRDDKRNNEAALKYFLLGSFATAFMLYGVAWIYGITGTTNLEGIRQALVNNLPTIPMPAVGAACALMFVGFAFKVSAAPFQVWAPDVYQGAPAPVSAFLSAGPKAAAFAVLLRTFMTAFSPISNRWEPIVWGCALLSMLVGNFAALTQTNIKRMLAYSSIAHAGYVMIAVASHSEIGTAAAMFYLAAYAFMNVGAFAIVTQFSRKGERYVNISDLAGLGKRQPLSAAMFSVFLLSLIGVPLTGGFMGKFYIFKAALDSDLIWLTVLGLLNSAVAAYYYLRIMVVMYFNEPGEGTALAEAPSMGMTAVLVGSALGTVVLGVVPNFILNLATKSAAMFR
ncbi:MAG TPA: NADH-quinone oxidoreductase subunit N [Bryobacteraceae bacterium]|jgi:NADH-quinone oxidoreductase subunit N